MKRFFVVFLLLLFAPQRSEAAEVIGKGETLTLDRCIAIALERQPNIIAAGFTARAAESRIGEAKAGYYPQIEWATSASRTSVGPRQSLGFRTGSAIFNSYSTGITLSQNIYDFGKTASQVEIQGLTHLSSLSDLDDVTGRVVLNVRQAYYAVLQSKRNREVSAETVKQFELHLEQAKGFFEVGTKPRFDVTKAEVDLSNAKLNLIRAENALRIAKVNLNNAMGVPDAPEYDIEDVLSFRKYEITLQDALTRAYENRPDIKAAASRRQAQERTVDLIKKDYYPALTGTAGYNYAGNEFPLARGWNIGATLSFPVFNGFLTKNQVEEARSTLKVLEANEEALRQTVILDVQQAFLNLREAEERIPAAELAVRQAEENFEIANGRYAAGVGNPIEVTDAQVALANAKTTHIQALYDYKVALANLERAMGTK